MFLLTGSGPVMPPIPGCYFKPTFRMLRTSSNIGLKVILISEFMDKVVGKLSIAKIIASYTFCFIVNASVMSKLLNRCH